MTYHAVTCTHTKHKNTHAASMHACLCERLFTQTEVGETSQFERPWSKRDPRALIVLNDPESIFWESGRRLSNLYTTREPQGGEKKEWMVCQSVLTRGDISCLGHSPERERRLLALRVSPHRGKSRLSLRPYGCKRLVSVSAQSDLPRHDSDTARRSTADADTHPSRLGRTSAGAFKLHTMSESRGIMHGTQVVQYSPPPRWLPP
jgi:hypothetical protein